LTARNRIGSNNAPGSLVGSGWSWGDCDQGPRIRQGYGSESILCSGKNRGYDRLAIIAPKYADIVIGLGLDRQGMRSSKARARVLEKTENGKARKLKRDNQ